MALFITLKKVASRFHFAADLEDERLQSLFIICRFDRDFRISVCECVFFHFILFVGLRGLCIDTVVLAFNRLLWFVLGFARRLHGHRQEA